MIRLIFKRSLGCLLEKRLAGEVRGEEGPGSSLAAALGFAVSRALHLPSRSAPLPMRGRVCGPRALVSQGLSPSSSCQEPDSKAVGAPSSGQSPYGKTPLLVYALWALG